MLSINISLLYLIYYSNFYIFFEKIEILYIESNFYKKGGKNTSMAKDKNNKESNKKNKSNKDKNKEEG
ncbi:hypothetical protein [Sporanaerobacter acetigenes]|uniref:hypothetical protein n=1 Tax=Sporanaerobacter acetigenes TaxID=165813 RepID=UPI0011604B8D|nr:hypothetical protein [Sporanaerobacter acetigenes]